MRNAAPEDVTIDLVFDQSVYVVNALQALVREGILGALLTGLMVLLFLREWRSALIVVTTIPFALLSSVVLLWLIGETINIMTLGGLALAVGILVDEATVAIESIHTHLASGLTPSRAVWEASRKTALPRLLAMLCVLSVFVPTFFMVGVGRQVFVPLALAVGFAMLSSYLLSSTLVPVLSMGLIGKERARGEGSSLVNWRARYGAFLGSLLRFRWPLVGAYLITSIALIYVLYPRIGTEIFPSVETGQLQLRLRAPTGTRLERTEVLTLQAMDVIKQAVGPQNVEITTGFIGVPTSNYPVNTIYLFTSGQHEALLHLALKPAASLRGEPLKEELRRKLKEALPHVSFSFEPPDIISQVMSFGSPTPIEVAVQGPNLALNRTHAEKIRRELERISSLRDLQYAQPLDYPTLEITVDRNRAGQLGIEMADVAKSVVGATSSSRLTDLNFWRDPRSGNAFQIQVQIPEYKMGSIGDVENLPIMNHPASPDAMSRPLLSDVATVDYGSTIGEVDRYNMQRVISLTANIHAMPLGNVAQEIRAALKRVGDPPRGVNVFVRGQIPALEDTLSGLRVGLLLSIVVIFLLLAANFQSFRLAITVIATAPAVVCGVLLLLLLTGTTMNVQSFMGAIMAIGIAVANAILLVTFAERSRREGKPVLEAALEGTRDRLRAILMTAAAMIAGMIPIALGIGESARQIAPLGRAVIGGLLAATLTTLIILPCVYAILQRRASERSPSLHPDDPSSRYYGMG